MEEGGEDWIGTGNAGRDNYSIYFIIYGIFVSRTTDPEHFV